MQSEEDGIVSPEADGDVDTTIEQAAKTSSQTTSLLDQRSRESITSIPPSRRAKQRHGKQTESEADEISLRELRKKAYSSSSLHTYKSDPLKRRKGDIADNKHGHQKGPKGQPNMKLRMEAMLEQIKRGIK